MRKTPEFTEESLIRDLSRFSSWPREFFPSQRVEALGEWAQDSCAKSTKFGLLWDPACLKLPVWATNTIVGLRHGKQAERLLAMRSMAHATSENVPGLRN